MALSDVTAAALAYGNEQYAQGYAQGKTDQAGVDQQIIDQAHTDLASVQQALVAETAKYDTYVATHPDTTPPPPPPPPPSGQAVLGASLDVSLNVVLPAVRVYQHNKFQASVSKGTKVVVLSTKDTTPSATVAEIKAAGSGVTFYLTDYHEPDDNITKTGDLTVAQYVSRLNAFGAAVKDLPNVHFGPIHNGWLGSKVWLADESGADKTLWDFWGEDRYADSYEDPETILAEGRDFAKGLGLPFLVGEVAAPNSDPTKQAAFAAALRTWALDPKNNVAALCWWVGTKGNNYNFANSTVQHAFLG